ncbi:serine acetyltransferase [bacterium (Candidatus Blackallbacteria) CG17_big_fil_post_rev_8_21_14_2_50_48_46]|uniref:Serine acetyltransferase n=1 Tax=bacterium (Candidatus Blackallbacteria) CG17_big_fil_post_rev_8_21_14_2_50_48_46 TaxID=2014261 RepID=A0A2M7G4Z0_9BACT|nr:MAG: serine acetyltransferase [bacterium (Candidatus Blackallbacteria) CG18_big_fil_WC_8_21_14_2_50_49_26]PIW16977.1 MAG: serine acetyltransferase [bacterium (Candidatus Blackallbacteria) CG17_big_fil_post_rev_8_21_14_2_50_48_46]PIW50256.1 MAG: serine acetyltransferase [bacterium (Candidatus Blackallbacteria) CG13_big_fil_rev_8_21_14_2_50_49_14]
MRLYKGLLHPRFAPVLLFRLASAFYALRLGVLSKFFALANQIVFGCDIARGAKIGGGLFLPHPNGVVIGAHVKIGRNCIIHQGVTLGARGEEHELANPIIGDQVEIATGAKILGGVHLDDYARIGANAVVLKDVPAYAVAVGIPARIVRQRADAQELLATPSAA